MKLGAEVFWNSKKEADGCFDIAFNVEGELSLSDRYRLLFSAGRSFREGPNLTAYFGLQIILKGLNKGGQQNGKLPSEKN